MSEIKPKKAWSARGPWLSYSGWQHPVFTANGKVRKTDNWRQQFWLSPVTGKWVSRMIWEHETYDILMGRIPHQLKKAA